MVQFIACVPDIVEMSLAGDPVVLLRLPADTVCEAFRQEIAENLVSQIPVYQAV